MQLEDYFDFLAPNDIRLKGGRIGIETILYEFIYNERCPDEMRQRFPTLSLEQLYATVLFYLHNKEQIHAYMTEYVEHGHVCMWEEQHRNPTPAALKLRKLRSEAKVPQRPG